MAAKPRTNWGLSSKMDLKASNNLIIHMEEYFWSTRMAARSIHRRSKAGPTISIVNPARLTTATLKSFEGLPWKTGSFERKNQGEILG